MKILIAEDDLVSRHLLNAKLDQWGYEVIAAKDGTEAWQILQQEDAPLLAILDWMMPGMDGIEICRRARTSARLNPVYFILLTTRNNLEDVVEGFQAGADDYVTKPFESQELRARVQAGARIVRLQSELAVRVKELEAALAKVKQLEGILPICSYCKKIRDDADYWHQLESYISEHSAAMFSHSICPDCYTKFFKS